MNIFVVGTGRCGTCTFYQAVSHATNFTSGHESIAGSLDRLSFPDNHIEVCPHLSICITKIRELYPNSKWVHLIRNKSECVASIASQCRSSLEKYAAQWYQRRQVRESEYEVLATQFYSDINDIIQISLVGTDYKVVRTEEVYTRWGEIWDWLELEGAFEASRSEWLKKYNSGGKRGRNNFVTLT